MEYGTKFYNCCIQSCPHHWLLASYKYNEPVSYPQRFTRHPLRWFFFNGSGVISPSCRYFSRCCLILFWSNRQHPGCSPYACKCCGKGNCKMAAVGGGGGRGGDQVWLQYLVWGNRLFLPWTVQGDRFRGGTIHGVTVQPVRFYCISSILIRYSLLKWVQLLWHYICSGSCQAVSPTAWEQGSFSTHLWRVDKNRAFLKLFTQHESSRSCSKKKHPRLSAIQWVWLRYFSMHDVIAFCCCFEMTLIEAGNFLAVEVTASNWA